MTITIEAALFISAVSLAFGIYQGLTNLKRNKTADDKQQASEMAAVLIKLELINKDTGEIKGDMKSVKTEVRRNSEKIIRLEESLKSAWKRINGMAGKDDDHD